MQFQIITFGNGEILKGVFDAIAMCLNSQTGTLYTPLLRIGMIFGVLWAAIYSIWGDFLKAWGRATLPFIFIPPLLFIPSSTVYIHDVVSNYYERSLLNSQNALSKYENKCSTWSDENVLTIF